MQEKSGKVNSTKAYGREVDTMISRCILRGPYICLYFNNSFVLNMSDLEA
jgi:hypothetical protein